MADAPLTPSERAELEQLRSAATTRQPRPGSRWRTLLATLLITIGCILAPLSVVATWLDREVSDTDRYVETVAPLIDDPELQRALAKAVTTEVFAALDVEGSTEEILTALAGRTDLPPALQDRVAELAGPIVSGVQGFVEDQVAEVVASDEFAQAWEDANRLAHEQLVATLTGDTPEGVTVDSEGRVTIDIAPFVELAKQQLVDRGFTAADRIPAIHREFLVFKLSSLPTAQTAFSALNTIGGALPFVTLGFLAAGVGAARDRRRALVGAGLGVAVAMLFVGAALAVGRVAYLDALPLRYLTRDSAGEAFDTLIRFLRTGLRAGFVLGIVVAAVAYLTGPSSAATAFRRGISAGLDRIRNLKGEPLAGPEVARTLTSYRTPIRIAVIGTGAIVLLFSDEPTPMRILLIAGLVLLVLAIVEVLSGPRTDELPPTPPE